ncbi:MAG: SDR family NAD(P)-dependent oxidoreductase [Rhodospirillales bacterium]|nr:SDR family NAD(P)-dependent oxidoreductase [Rhodospirillales bacterium]MCB9977843.1 SDR family NAD(P)-dependent oxidoreductase [Rhodospirillales bacterium]
MGLAAKDLKTIVITGASSGIGAALAQHYAGPGIVLGLTGRDEARLASVKEACIKKGAEVVTQVLDVTDQQAMQVWLTAFDDGHPIDLVVANAGISAGPGPLTLEDPVRAREVFAVNFTGVLNTIDPVLPRMIERRRGHVALMSSLAGFRGFPGAPAYTASKAAVRLYGEALVNSLKKHRVGVHVICPGFVESSMTARNPFKMPFLMSAEEAAGRVARGLEQGKTRIAFPWPMLFAVRFLACLPDGLALTLTRETPSKPR